MIEINLLPQRLKKKKKRIKFNIPQFPQETIVGIAAALLCGLFCIHLLLVAGLIINKIRFTSLNRNWQKIQPTKTEVDGIKEEIGRIENKLNFFTKTTQGDRRILWAKKLNQLSDFLPPGVWFTKLSTLNDKLIIEGSAISKRGEEMVMVGKFTAVLKNDPGFAQDFASIELTSINRRLIKSVEVADFVITARVKD